MSANPSLSKILAIEDALIKAKYRSGGELQSETRIHNSLLANESLSFKSNIYLTHITIRSCQRFQDLLKCLIALEYGGSVNVRPSVESIDICDDRSDFQICYEMREKDFEYNGSIYFLRGEFSLLLKNSGIVRYRQQIKIHGLGSDKLSAISSLKKQAKLRAYNWYVSNTAFIESEKSLVLKIIPQKHFNKEALLKEGLFPMELLERNGRVYVFCRTIQFN